MRERVYPHDVKLPSDTLPLFFSILEEYGRPRCVGDDMVVFKLYFPEENLGRDEFPKLVALALRGEFGCYVAVRFGEGERRDVGIRPTHYRVVSRNGEPLVKRRFGRDFVTVDYIVRAEA